MLCQKMLPSVPFLIIRRAFSQSNRLMGFINPETRSQHVLEHIGRREMVGFGTNGLPIYDDRPDFPFPALRYKEITSELQGLFEKQKGNWNELTKGEKKTLYRANYRQTFAEFKAPTGQWMEIIGYSLILCSLGVWMFIFFQIFIAPPKPDSFSPARVRAQMRRMIDLQVNPITGFSSNWDYEKNDWKVKKWNTPPNPFIRTADDNE